MATSSFQHHAALSGHAVQHVYLSVFKQATRRQWFGNVLDMNETIECLRRGLKKAGLPTHDLEARREQIEATVEETERVMDFFDLLRMLRHFFHGVEGKPAGMVAKAVVGVCAANWPLTMSPDALRLAKGFAYHLSEGVAPRDMTEFELSCLMLRPRIAAGMPIYQVTSGRYGEVVAMHTENAIEWRPYEPANAEVLPEGDMYSLIPLTPILQGIPLTPASPFPRVTRENVWAEFAEYFPSE